MRTNPHGVIPREHRDGVRDTAPTPPIVLVDPDVTAPPHRVLGCAPIPVASFLLAIFGAVVIVALAALAGFSLALSTALLLAAAAIVAERLDAECKRDADASGDRSLQQDVKVLRLALGVALGVALGLAIAVVLALAE